MTVNREKAKISGSKFVFGKSYNSDVKSMLSVEGCIDIAVAYVGSGANSWFCSKKSKYRLIINLSSGATNPDEIRKIQKRKNCDIRQIDNLHAKVFISDKATIIGSANLSANGVGLEGSETSNLEEAGTVTSTFDNIRQWFEDLWKNSRIISEDDLKNAKEKWLQRIASRPIVIKKGSLDFLKDRRIALLVSWEKIEPKKKKEADEEFTNMEINKGLKPDKNAYAYEGFNIDKGTIYFDYWIRNQGKGEMICNGIVLPMTPRRSYGGIEYLLRDDNKLHHDIRLKDYQGRITSLLKAYIKTVELPNNAGGFIVKLNDIL